MEDLMLRVLIVAAIVSIILSFLDKNQNWFDGYLFHLLFFKKSATIIFVIVLIVGITVSYSYNSER